MKQKTNYQNHLEFRVILGGNTFWVIFALGKFCSGCMMLPPKLPAGPQKHVNRRRGVNNGYGRAEPKAFGAGEEAKTCVCHVPCPLGCRV